MPGLWKQSTINKIMYVVGGKICQNDNENLNNGIIIGVHIILYI